MQKIFKKSGVVAGILTAILFTPCMSLAESASVAAVKSAAASEEAQIGIWKEKYPPALPTIVPEWAQRLRDMGKSSINDLTPEEIAEWGRQYSWKFEDHSHAEGMFLRFKGSDGKFILLQIDDSLCGSSEEEQKSCPEYYATEDYWTPERVQEAYEVQITLPNGSVRRALVANSNF